MVTSAGQGSALLPWVTCYELAVIFDGDGADGLESGGGK